VPSYYTCFFHPKETRDENSLDDKCPDCGRLFRFPLETLPEKIGRFRVVKALGRGFYGVTYLVESGSLGVQDVLKVVPAPVYKFFDKDFEAECRLHKEVAEETEHVVSIRDMFDESIQFDGESLACHVAILEYVPGISLSEFIDDPDRFQARSVAQVAIDLLRLLQELESKQQYHNDLHGDNIRIRELGPASRRADAIDESIRAVAIDLGSLSNASRSNPDSLRLGDLHEIARHLLALSERLLRDPDNTADLEYRLAHVIREIGLMLSPDSLQSSARIGLRDCEQWLIEESASSISPWKPPGKLRRFSDAFNAQTMHSWFVPRLLVDPDDEWLTSVSTPMPTVISGIRGCGKTMLLRALQFHARASEDEGGPDAIKQRLEEDNYVGLYVSCNRLLDGPGGPQDQAVHEPYARLFIAYAREALQAARHLREISRTSIRSDYHRLIGQVVADHVEGAENLGEMASESSLERALQLQLVSLAKGERTHTLRANPAVAFPQLAEAIRRCSPVWEASIVLFLLDDVSTRHLNQVSIEQLLSSLLYKDETCAFKLTTEAQVLELLLSPGLIEKLQLNRDVDLFDLGGEVNDRLRDKAGRKFISDILARRANQLESHPDLSPADLLGNATLSSLAKKIAAPKDPSKRDREGVYHGIGALQAACVGDIGDAIAIYELIYRSWDRDGRKAIPVPSRLQSGAYQDYAIRCLYHLNRRDNWLRQIALSFARASNQLLGQSYRKMHRRGKGRLRQYATMHVDLEGAKPETFERLRELIDAGVFVFDKGPMSPRSKTQDEDPVSQFILTYRKLYGLSNYIGLSERDRFELGASDLEAWFDEPADESHLTRKLGGAPWQAGASDGLSGSDPNDDIAVDDDSPETDDQPAAARLFDVIDRPADRFRASNGDEEERVLKEAFLENRVARARLLPAEELAGQGVTAVIAGLGFEDRTEASARRVFENLSPQRAVLMEYTEPGHTVEIKRRAELASGRVELIPYQSTSHTDLVLPEGPILIDVTGMPKSLIFGLVRRALQRDGRLIVTHTKAEKHYPLNEEIAALRAQFGDKPKDAFGLLEAADDQVFSGDRTGAYTHRALLPGNSDAARRRLLCAGASAKHQRLLSLLDVRSYDHLEILVPDGESHRTWLAQQTAAVARQETNNTAQVDAVDGDDLNTIMRLTADRYRVWYGAGGFDVEMGLTGSKTQAIAFGALSTTLKIAQCWYIEPSGFDPERFSSGVGETRHFELSLPPAPQDDP
jgi:hypothetical protein